MQHLSGAYSQFDKEISPTPPAAPEYGLMPVSYRTTVLLHPVADAGSPWRGGCRPPESHTAYLRPSVFNAAPVRPADPGAEMRYFPALAAPAYATAMRPQLLGLFPPVQSARSPTSCGTVRAGARMLA